MNSPISCLKRFFFVKKNPCEQNMWAYEPWPTYQYSIQHKNSHPVSIIRRPSQDSTEHANQKGISLCHSYSSLSGSTVAQNCCSTEHASYAWQELAGEQLVDIKQEIYSLLAHSCKSALILASLLVLHFYTIIFLPADQVVLHLTL